MSMDWNKYRELNMKGLADFHCHTLFCDGLDSAEDMVLAAIAKGMKVIGFSGHSYMPYDESYCMIGKQVEEYRNEVRRLAVKYGDRIEVLCGIEQDCLAGMPDTCWDYVIGSVHNIRCGDEYVQVDETEEITRDAVEKIFNGDVYAYVEKYYETVATVISRCDADMIGHFDIVCKFNRGGEHCSKGILFDEGNPRYVAAWKKAAEQLVKEQKEKGRIIPFEINFAPVAKGIREEPYPSEEIQEYIRKIGGTFMYSSDSHEKKRIGDFMKV